MKQKVMLFYGLVLSTLCSACAVDEKPVTQVFPPTLSFVEPIIPEEEQIVEEIRPVVQKVQVFPEFPTVSGFLDAREEESYHAYNTMDGDETTAWVEGASGLGAGEWVEHSFQWPKEVQEVWFYNGHGGNMDEFSTAKKVALSFSDGKELIYVAEAGWNQIVLEDVVETTFVRLTILDGQKAKREDVAISEIKIFNASSDKPTPVLDKEAILATMGALGDCSNITSEQAAAFAKELQSVMAWAESNAEKRAYLGSGYDNYKGEALLFSGNDGVPVLYYDYDFTKVDELFLTETDVVVWDGKEAHGGYFEQQGANTSINWILPGYVYVNNGEYFFGLTEYDMYGSGSFGLVAMVGFDKGMPRSKADYVAFLSHNSTGAYTYGTELQDYLKMPLLSSFPTYQLEDLVTRNKQDYFEFNGINFELKNLVWDVYDSSTWYAAIRSARVEAGYEQVTQVQSGETVLAGLLALS